MGRALHVDPRTGTGVRGIGGTRKDPPKADQEKHVYKGPGSRAVEVRKAENGSGEIKSIGA